MVENAATTSIEDATRQYCDQMQMEPESPLRATFMLQARHLAKMDGTLDRMGSEVADRAAEATMRILRERHGVTLASIGRTRLALLGIGAALLVGVTWIVRGAMPVATAFGPMPPAMARALVATDAATAWDRRLMQPAVNGKTWSLVPFWDESGAPTPRQ